MSERVVRLKIELLEVQPPIWRRVDVPVSTNLADLHAIIQHAMGWEFAHLYEFEIGKQRYEDDFFQDDDFPSSALSAQNARLQPLIARGYKRFSYLYDFGDCWRHEIRSEGVRDGEAGVDYPVFVEGAGRCPPEDVGGTSGFYDFLEAIGDPSHEEHSEWVAWRGPFDPEDIDEERARAGINEIAKSRRRSLARQRRSRSRKSR